MVKYAEVLVGSVKVAKSLYSDKQIHHEPSREEVRETGTPHARNKIKTY